MSFFQEIIKERPTASIKSLATVFLLGILAQGSAEINMGSGIATMPHKTVQREHLVLNQREGRWYYKEKPFSGYQMEWHCNGVLAEQTGYLEGKRHGPALKWYDNGILLSQKNYVANRLEGVAKTWWPTGQQSSESNYRNRQRHGKQTKWYPSGQIARVTRFIEGKEEGLQQAWLKTGKLYANYEAKGGRFFGLKRSNLCYQLSNEVVQK